MERALELGALESQSRRTRGAALEELIRRGPASVPILVQLLRSSRAETRRIAAEELCKLGQRQRLLHALRDSRIEIRDSSAEALFQYEPEALRRELIKMSVGAFGHQITAVQWMLRFEGSPPPEWLRQLLVWLIEIRFTDHNHSDRVLTLVSRYPLEVVHTAILRRLEGEEYPSSIATGFRVLTMLNVLERCDAPLPDALRALVEERAEWSYVSCTSDIKQVGARLLARRA